MSWERLANAAETPVAAAAHRFKRATRRCARLNGSSCGHGPCSGHGSGGGVAADHHHSAAARKPAIADAILSTLLIMLIVCTSWLTEPRSCAQRPRPCQWRGFPPFFFFFFFFSSLRATGE